MKKIAFYLMVLIAFIGCTQKMDKLPEGTWKMVNYQTYSGDTLLMDYVMNDSDKQVKIWSKNYFMFVGQYKDSITHDNYGGGTYKLNGNQYEEFIEYHSYKEYVGKTIKLLLELKNDTLIQTFPVDENWKTGKKYYIERYVRM